jgi:lipopolysaccharide export system protein LptA
VSISTPEDSAKGNEAVYDAKTGVATLCGNVEIRRGPSVLKGKCAEVNLNTGVSRLIGGGGSVKGLVQPPN